MTNTESVTLMYQLFAASCAGTMIGTFPTQAAASQFYDATHGPLPFARSIYANDRLASAFVQAFMPAFEKTGFQVYGPAPTPKEST